MPRPPGGPAAIAARLTWGSLAGPALDDGDRARLAAGLGGVVLFERNVVSPGQLRALTAAIRDAAAGPVRISIDQEGGHVVRVREPLTPFAPPMGIAATGSLRLAREVAAASGRELRALGIDTVLAPVLDVAVAQESPVIGPRSFGDDPSDVASFGAAAVRGYLEGGVIPVPKHLPGHGRTAEDSHTAPARVGGSRADLAAEDLPPFAAAIAAGAPALMAGHVTYDALDAGHPASLAPALARLVREQLGFRGVLVTDALVMDSVAGRFPLEEAGVLAIRAGMDAVMALEGQRRVLAGLAAAIDAGRLPDARVREALHRAGELDVEAATLPGRPLGTPLADAALDRHARLAREVAERSLTLVEDPAGLLPLAGSLPVLVVDVAAAPRSPVEGPAGVVAGIGERLARAIGGARVVASDPADVDGFEAAEAAAADAGLVVLLTRDGFAGPAAALARRLAARGPLVHVALRNPLDLAGTRAAAARVAPALVAAYAETPPTMVALADALTGRIAFRGRLPVALDASTAPGRGLEAVAVRAAVALEPSA